MSGSARPATCGSELVRGPLAELDGNAALRAISVTGSATVARRRRSRRRSTSTASSGSSTTCSTTSTARRWRTRSRCACPFLDHHVVELCATIPARLKVRRLETKHVLKHAARGLVPDRIIDKPKIGFFNAAVDDWFRAQTRGAISRLPARPEPALRGVPRPRPRSSGSSREHADGADTGNALRAALDPDARGLALVVPAARAGRPTRPQRERVTRPHDRATYAVVTPARNEAANLAAARRGARRADASARAPGSSSTTARRTRRSSSSRELAREHAWIDVALAAGRDGRPRAARPIVRALAGGHRGARPSRPTSSSSSTPTSRSSPTTSSACSRAFAADPRSGSRAAAPSSSRTATWRERHVTGSTVWGASRAYRWECLAGASSRSRSGSAGTASTSSRRTRAAGRRDAFEDLPFRHHRREGERDGTAWRARREPGPRGPLHRLPPLVPRRCARSGTRARSRPRSR